MAPSRTSKTTAALVSPFDAYATSTSSSNDAHAHLRKFPFDNTFRTAVTPAEIKSAEERLTTIKCQINAANRSTEGDIQWIQERIRLCKDQIRNLGHDLVSLQNQEETLKFRLERGKKVINDEIKAVQEAVKDSQLVYREMDKKELVKNAYKKGHLPSHHRDVKCPTCRITAPGHFPANCPRAKEVDDLLESIPAATAAAVSPNQTTDSSSPILPSPNVERTRHRKSKKSAQKKAKKVSWGVGRTKPWGTWNSAPENSGWSRPEGHQSHFSEDPYYRWTD
ncbi:hypothetical protein H1R20_g1856, partial [Candolleomyces eurysporus]